MDDNELDPLQKFMKNPFNREDLDSAVEFLKNSGKKEEAERIRIEFISKIAPNVSTYVMWVSEYMIDEKTKDRAREILKIALKDYPNSIELHKLKASLAENMLESVKESVKVIGDFDNEIWDLYRSLDPEHIESIYKEQFTHPIPNRNSEIELYELEHLSVDNSEQQKFELSDEALLTNDVLTLEKWDLSKVGTAFRVTEKVKTRSMFERCLIVHPHNGGLWMRYLRTISDELKNKNNKDLEEELHLLTERAVRLTPECGAVWGQRAVITKRVSLDGFAFIKNPKEANALVAQLVALAPQQAETSVRGALSAPAYGAGQNLTTPILILDEFFRSCGGARDADRRELLRWAVGREPSRVDLWLRLAEFEERRGSSPEDIRAVFKEAVHKLKDVDSAKDPIKNAWLSFEASQGSENLDAAIQEISKIWPEAVDFENDAKNENGRKDEVVKPKAQIYVKGFPDGMTEESIIKLFDGAISASVRNRHAIVSFDDAEKAQKAIGLMNGTVYEGSMLTVDTFRKDKGASLFARFSPHAEPLKLLTFIRSRCGEVVDGVVVRPVVTNGSVQRGRAFVDAPSGDAADAIQKLSGELFLNRTLTFERAKNRPKYNPRDNSRAASRQRDDYYEKCFSNIFGSK